MKGDERKPHRSDLCEACDSFGNCQGAFFEPFIMSSAIALHTNQMETKWAMSGDILFAKAGRYYVAMLPHVFASLAGSIASGGGQGYGGRNSWESKGGGKGKANSIRTKGGSKGNKGSKGRWEGKAKSRRSKGGGKGGPGFGGKGR
eukprot:NODE_25031_length_602_cov_1.313684.p1 GENE.NODE_25031_length_602_cov_1.313684~~NODE_25031_length_602_cov_1.313684.p1  ORF type:complete len:168 (+),score=32.26 NODE_25031_length_602_cov_1.313684:69-506(+)